MNCQAARTCSLVCSSLACATLKVDTTVRRLNASFNITVTHFYFQSKGEYSVYSTFQSHEPQFDYLKSLEIEEKINEIQWLKRQNNNLFLLSTNGKYSFSRFSVFITSLLLRLPDLNFSLSTLISIVLKIISYKSQFNSDSKLNESNMLAMITAVISISVCLHLMRV